MKNTIFIVLWIFCNFYAGQATGQNRFIVVEKMFTDKQIVYRAGDEIVYKLKREKFFRNNRIVSLNDSAMVFHYVNILYHEIEAVDIRGHRFGGSWRGIGTILQFVGIAYIAIDQFNQVVVGGDPASFNEEVWIAGGVIAAAGTLMKLASPKKVKLGGKYRIRYMNITQY